MEKENAYSEIFGNLKSGPNEFVDKILSESNNFIQRFIAFILFSQLLYIVLFIGTFCFVKFNLYGMSKLFMFGVFCIGLFLLFIFLFKNVKAKTLTFLSVGSIYFIFCALVATTIKFDSISDFILSFFVTDLSNPSNPAFLGGWAAWNLFYGIIILSIGFVRTFTLGTIYDYKKKENESMK